MSIPSRISFTAVYIGRNDIAVLGIHPCQRCDGKDSDHSKHKEENLFFTLFTFHPPTVKSGCSCLQATASVFVSSTLTRWYRQLLIIVLQLLRIVNRIYKSCTILPIPARYFRRYFRKIIVPSANFKFFPEEKIRLLNFSNECDIISINCRFPAKIT